ncbi:MAG: proteasome subunit beta [Candidatus Methanomethylicia archaeon]|nr:proteasome subunit beta [Candidatus Methanomethylicia archaeon]
MSPQDIEAKFALYERLKKGTTTVGVVCRDGVVLATDRRVTSGLYVAHKRGRKLFILDDNKAATIAGLVADAQMIMDYLRSHINMLKLGNRGPVSTKSVATLASNILFSSRYFPYIVQFIVAGFDESGPKIYVLDWFGTLTEEKFVSTGSGSPYAVGVLEATLKRNPSVSEALPVIAKAVKSAIERDPGSGEGIDVMILTKEGIKELTDEEISRLLQQ